MPRITGARNAQQIVLRSDETHIVDGKYKTINRAGNRHAVLQQRIDYLGQAIALLHPGSRLNVVYHDA